MNVERIIMREPAGRIELIQHGKVAPIAGLSFILFTLKNSTTTVFMSTKNTE